jgi:transcriptional regulator EpsA
MLCDTYIVQLHTVLGECHELDSLDDLKTFIRTRIRRLLPHGTAMCALGDIHGKRVLRLLNIDFPSGYLRRIIRPDRVMLSMPFRYWITRRSPIFIRIDRGDENEEDASWHAVAREFDITTFACHGILDLSGAVFSYFEFGDIDVDLRSHRAILHYVVPHLHAALVRLLSEEYLNSNIKVNGAEEPIRLNAPDLITKPLDFDLTEREREILTWIAAGKSNWEIGKILVISEFTVKNHVQNVLKKMSATSRTQAATIAISCGMINEDDWSREN